MLPSIMTCTCFSKSFGCFTCQTIRLMKVNCCKSCLLMLHCVTALFSYLFPCEFSSSEIMAPDGKPKRCMRAGLLTDPTPSQFISSNYATQVGVGLFFYETSTDRCGYRLGSGPLAGRGVARGSSVLSILLFL